MSVMTAPYNIQSHAGALAEGLGRGDRLHIGTVGNWVFDDFYFVGFYQDGRGVVIARGSVDANPVELPWGDIVELWPLEEKPNPYHSDIPEVAEVLQRIKAAVRRCVADDNSPGVLYLMNEILVAKRAEPLLKEARELLAGIRV